MRLRARALFALLALTTAAFAQDPPAPTPPGPPSGRPKREAKEPVFTPPAADAPATPAAPAPANPQDPTSRPAPTDPADELVALFVKWPARAARDAAEAIGGYGARVEDRLIACLDHNDWRLQAAAAYALGRMGAKRAVPALVRAIREPTNRQSLSELMNALGRVDPERGPAEILPFLGHASARVRDAALAALPPALDAVYLPELLELARGAKGQRRAVALELFGRIPGGAEHEELFDALNDPETEPAHAAARLLGLHAGEPGLARVVGVAKDGTMRASAYAMLALVYAEDRRGRKAPADDDALRVRGVRMLHSDDPLYRGAAAVLLANLAFRSDEAQLVELADKYLVPILLDTVASGVFFSDYAAVEEPSFRKLELLTGEPFGKNAPRWRQWWSRAANGFVARRLLRSVTAEELRASTLDVRRVAPDGDRRTVVFAGDAAPADAVPPSAYLLAADDCARALALLTEAAFFAGDSDARDAVEGGFVEIGVARGRRRFERRLAGARAAELLPLAEKLFRIADGLAWQRFAPADPVLRLAWLADRRAELAALAPEERDDAVRALALAGYAGFTAEARDAAVALVARAPEAWLARNAEAVAGWLATESSCGARAEALFAALAPVPSPAARDAALSFAVRTPGPRTEEALGGFLARQPFAGCLAALKAKAGPVRAVGARALARFGGEPDAAPALIDGLRDPDARVRDACVRSLADMKDPRTPALIDAVLAGGDKSLRVRAIEALGAVGGDESVPRLVGLFREGDVHERGAALRALERAAGRRAQIALAAIARESADVLLATEAVLALSRIGGDEAAERVASLLNAAGASRDVRLQCVGALAAMLGPRAAPALAAALQDQDPAIRRVATLSLGRVGGREALEPLLRAMEAPAGDAAADDAFRRLTYFAGTPRTPRERFLEARAWADEHGAKPRSAWFRLALEAAGLEPSALDGALNGGALDAGGYGLLVRALRTPAGPLRTAADDVLRRTTGLVLAPLGADASEEATAARTRAFETWAERNGERLRAGVAVPPGVWDPPTPLPASAPAAPASRPR